MYHPTTRVLTVLELLQSHHRITGPELAERLEVNIRTARRYITMLQDLGMPIEAERGRYGAYRLRPGFKLPPLMFTEDEALAVTLGLLAARRLGLVVTAPTVEGALVKIERVLPPQMRERVKAVQESLVLELNRSESTPPSAIVLELSAAVQQERRVVLRYRSWSGAETERQVDVYGLVYRTGHWYAVGFCHLRGGLRLFRLDRVLSVALCEASFVRPDDIDLVGTVQRGIANTPGTWLIEVMLHTDLDDAKAHVAPDWATLEQNADGVLLRCYSDDLDMIARSLVFIGRPMTVLRPPEMRAALRRLANDVLAYAERE